MSLLAHPQWIWIVDAWAVIASCRTEGWLMFCESPAMVAYHHRHPHSPWNRRVVSGDTGSKREREGKREGERERKWISRWTMLQCSRALCNVSLSFCGCLTSHIHHTCIAHTALPFLLHELCTHIRHQVQIHEMRDGIFRWWTEEKKCAISLSWRRRENEVTEHTYTFCVCNRGALRFATSVLSLQISCIQSFLIKCLWWIIERSVYFSSLLT